MWGLVSDEISLLRHYFNYLILRGSHEVMLRAKTLEVRYNRSLFGFSIIINLANSIETTSLIYIWLRRCSYQHAIQHLFHANSVNLHFTNKLSNGFMSSLSLDPLLRSLLQALIWCTGRPALPVAFQYLPAPASCDWNGSTYRDSKHPRWVGSDEGFKKFMDVPWCSPRIDHFIPCIPDFWP